MNLNRFPPEMVADALELLQAIGFLNVQPDPNDSSSVLVSAAPKLAAMIGARGLTLEDFGTSDTD
jgi:hypothetical protein